FVEPDVAIANLHEAEGLPIVRHHRRAGRLAEWRAFENATRQRPDGARSRPCHALQKVASIEVFLVICSGHTYLLHGRRKFAPHTSSPPKCPVTATSVPAANKAVR